MCRFGESLFSPSRIEVGHRAGNRTKTDLYCSAYKLEWTCINPWCDSVCGKSTYQLFQQKKLQGGCANKGPESVRYWLNLPGLFHGLWFYYGRKNESKLDFEVIVSHALFSTNYANVSCFMVG